MLNSRAPGAAKSDRKRRDSPPSARAQRAGRHPSGPTQARPRPCSRQRSRPSAPIRGPPPAAGAYYYLPLDPCSACNAHLSAEASTDAPQLVQDVEALAEGVFERGPEAQSGSRRSEVTDDSNPNCLVATSSLARCHLEQLDQPTRLPC